jgi:hypothetical protein
VGSVQVEFSCDTYSYLETASFQPLKMMTGNPGFKVLLPFEWVKLCRYISVRCGAEHTVALCVGGRLYAWWGLHSCCIQLTHSLNAATDF